MGKVHVVTYTGFTGSTRVWGVFTSAERAKQEAEQMRLLSHAVAEAWHAKVNWRPDLSRVAELARCGRTDEEIRELVRPPEAHPEHPFEAEDVEIHEEDVLE